MAELSALERMALNSYKSHLKKNGIKSMLITIDERDELAIDTSKEEAVLVTKKDHEQTRELIRNLLNNQ